MDLENILSDGSEAITTTDEELVSSLTAPPPRPPPSVYLPSPGRFAKVVGSFGVVWSAFRNLFVHPKRFVLLALTSTMCSRAPVGQAIAVPSVSYVEISRPLTFAPPNEFGVQIHFESISWRSRRRYKRLSTKVEQSMFKKLMLAPRQLPPEHSEECISRMHTTNFLRPINPAREAMQWAMATHMDEVMRQHQFLDVKEKPSGQERVSVNFKHAGKPLKFGEPFKAVNIGAIEAVFNSLGKMAVTPLIVDSGASCCLSPRREDFVTYSASEVRIKDLSGINKVAGEGMIEWQLEDRYGKPCTILIKGYHVPKATVRLISPQCLCQSFKGTKMELDHNKVVLRFVGGTILDAPYGAANLPLLKLSDPDNLNCRWLQCFSFRNTSPSLWADNVIAANNQNLTAAQKELLRWHHRISHAGLSTIHNLCRQKRQPKVESVGDLVPIRDGAMLPCTFNVPSCSREGLLCAACMTANATRRAPCINSSTSKPEKEKVIKADDTKPGDCISCDHFSSPVKGHVSSPRLDIALRLMDILAALSSSTMLVVSCSLTIRSLILQQRQFVESYFLNVKQLMHASRLKSTMLTMASLAVMNSRNIVTSSDKSIHLVV
jgi:hypothetical protein